MELSFHVCGRHNGLSWCVARTAERENRKFSDEFILHSHSSMRKIENIWLCCWRLYLFYSTEDIQEPPINPSCFVRTAHVCVCKKKCLQQMLVYRLSCEVNRMWSGKHSELLLFVASALVRSNVSCIIIKSKGNSTSIGPILKATALPWVCVCVPCAVCRVRQYWQGNERRQRPKTRWFEIEQICEEKNYSCATWLVVTTLCSYDFNGIICIGKSDVLLFALSKLRLARFT